MCPNIYLYDHYSPQLSYDKEEGTFTLEKVIQLPNHRKFIEFYELKYHSCHEQKIGWVTKLPKNDFVKKCLQEGLERANDANWRFREVAKKKVSKSSNQSTTMPKSGDKSTTGTVLLSGIL